MKPNIFFLLIDSFRNDKFFGNSKSSFTPNLDKLRNSGTYFSQNISSADGTTLSLNSIFTGLFPCVTGTRKIKLSLELENYLSSLKKYGYSIYSVTPNLSSFKSLINLSEKNFSYVEESPTASLFDGVGQKIIDLLSENKKEPWFFYSHILDLHWPLIVPEQFNNTKFGNTNYDQIVSSIDHYLGMFLEKIDVNNTIIIITSDHGCPIPFDGKDETFFEPELNLGLNVGKKIMPKFTHKFGAKFFIKSRNFVKSKRLDKENKNLTNYQIRSRIPPFVQSLFDELIRTPLLITGPNIKSNIINNQVRCIDIFPTLYDILKLEYHYNSQGQSLLPLMEGKKVEEKPCYVHTIPHEQLSDNDLVGIRTSNFKYFRHARNPKLNVHFFDLLNDEFENHNIANENPEKVLDMESLISKFSSFTQISSDTMDENEEEKIRNELKKLGYL